MSGQRDWFAVPIEEFGLGRRAARVARRTGAKTVGELCQRSDYDVLVAGWSEVSLNEICQRLAAFGLRLRDDKAGPCITPQG